MSDDLERRLKEFPSEFPRPDEEVTSRVAEELRRRVHRPKPGRTFALAGALLAALAAGTAIGSVATPASAVGVSIGVRPALVRYAERPQIFGAVTSGKADEDVTVQFKQCGLYPAQFRDLMSTKTIAGGAWSLDELMYVRQQLYAGGLFRAQWGDQVSEEVRLQMRAGVDLRRLPRGGRFTVRVFGTQSFWHKRVRVERFDTRSRKWILVRSLLLTDSEGSRDYGQPILISATAPFRSTVPKGTTLRAVLPLAAARPCYLAGYSLLQRA